MTDKKRVNVFLAPDVFEKLQRMAKQLDQSYTGVGALAVKLGLNLLELSLSKEFAEIITKDPEMIEKLERMVLDAEKKQ